MELEKRFTLCYNMKTDTIPGGKEKGGARI